MNVGVLSMICLIIALVFFALAAFFNYRYADGSRGWAVAVGLFFYALRDLLGALLVVAILFVALQPSLAHAETITYDEAADTGIPKGVVGYDGIRCTGVSTVGDLTYKNTIYIGADAGMMDRDPKRERAWQTDHCQYMQNLQHQWFWQKQGLTFVIPGAVITVERV